MGAETFNALAKFEEIYRYLSNAMMNRKVPPAMKYSVGEDILSGFMEVGSKIYLANQYRLEGKTYKAKQLVTAAYEDFQKVEYKIRLYSQDDRTRIKREYVFGLETEFKKMLLGWGNSLDQPRREMR